MAGAGIGRDRDRPVPGALVARALAVAPRGRACNRSRRLFPARRRGVCAAPHAARAQQDRRPQTARSQFRPAASAGDRDRRRDCSPDAGFVFDRAVARPCRARVARGHDAQGRRADAAAGVARSLRLAHARCGARGRHLRRRRRRTAQARRRRLRLAGRHGAGQFPHRRLGEPADLYRQAAVDSAGSAVGRAGADRHRDLGAGRQHAGDPCHRNSSRRGRQRRARRALVRCAIRQCAGHRGTPLRDQRCGCGDRTRRGFAGRQLAVHRHPGQAADHRDRQGSGRPGARRLAALLQARGRLRRRRRAGDLQAAGRRRNQRPAAACALRCARFPAVAAAGAYQERRRPDHQGLDRASLGWRRRGDDPDRARRGRQRRAECGVRAPPARAAVRQADGARAH